MTVEQKEMTKRLYATLSSIPLMESVKIGDFTWSAFNREENGNTYFLLDPEFVIEDTFGQNNDYNASRARSNVNNCEASKQVVEILGKDSLVPLEIDLFSHDGSGSYDMCKGDLFGVRTYDMQRKNYHRIKRCYVSEFLSTPDSTPSGYGSSGVRCVGFSGNVGYTDCSYSTGVRPFFILKSF